MNYSNETASGGKAPDPGTVSHSAARLVAPIGGILSLIDGIEDRLQIGPTPALVEPPTQPSRSGLAATIDDAFRRLDSAARRLSRISEAL